MESQIITPFQRGYILETGRITFSGPSKVLLTDGKPVSAYLGEDLSWDTPSLNLARYANGGMKMEKKSYPFFYGGKKQHWGKAVVVGGFVFLSGVSGRELSSGETKSLDVKIQTRTAWEKIDSILQEVGSSLQGIVKMVIYLRRAEDYDAYYEETCRYLNTCCPDLLDNPPAMTLVEAGLYQKEMLVEIEVTAILTK